MQQLLRQQEQQNQQQQQQDQQQQDGDKQQQQDADGEQQSEDNTDSQADNETNADSESQQQSEQQQQEAQPEQQEQPEAQQMLQEDSPADEAEQQQAVHEAWPNATPEEQQRWDQIRGDYQRQRKMGGAEDDPSVRVTRGLLDIARSVEALQPRKATEQLTQHITQHVAQPLAARLRAASLDEYVGQEHLLGARVGGRLVRVADHDRPQRAQVTAAGGQRVHLVAVLAPPARQPVGAADRCGSLLSSNKPSYRGRQSLYQDALLPI